MINRAELAAVGETFLKLVAHFLCGGRVCGATGQKKRDRHRQQGFHLEML